MVAILPQGNICTLLQWRHNERDGVSNHLRLDCLLSRLFRRKSKKTSKFRITGLCEGNHRWPMDSPHKGPITRTMFPFDDVINHVARKLIIRMNSFVATRYWYLIWIFKFSKEAYEPYCIAVIVKKSQRKIKRTSLVQLRDRSRTALCDLRLALLINFPVEIAASGGTFLTWLLNGWQQNKFSLLRGF